MDQNENTRSGPEQAQSTELPESEQPKAEQSKIEPARTCKLCGSPNHHACGCESRAMKERTRITMPAAPDFEQFEDVFVKMTKDFINEAISTLHDGVQYLKVIADDVITIRQILKDDKKSEETNVTGEN